MSTMCVDIEPCQKYFDRGCFTYRLWILGICILRLFNSLLLIKDKKEQTKRRQKSTRKLTNKERKKKTTNKQQEINKKILCEV